MGYSKGRDHVYEKIEEYLVSGNKKRPAFKQVFFFEILAQATRAFWTLDGTGLRQPS